MILRPIPAPAAEADAGASFVSAWEAIACTQRPPLHKCWMVTQPDHAILAGDLAVAMIAPWLPQLPSDVLRAIAVHDFGWAEPDRQALAYTAQSPGDPAARPRSFLQAAAEEFISAWTASIERAEQISPLSGILVSRHFTRLGQTRAQAGASSADDERRLWRFLTDEAQRRRLLEPRQSSTAAQICVLVDVLQLCDLLSLYLCCGARRPVQFPQRFADRCIRLRPQPPDPENGGASEIESTAARLHPSPLQRPLSLAVEATRYPAASAVPSMVAIRFLLW